MASEPVQNYSLVGRSRLTWGALLRRSLVYFALLYLTMLGLLMLLEGTLIFRPTRAEEEWFDRPGFVKQDVWLDLESGERIHAWWCPLASASWFVLYCHGNAGNLSFRSGTIERWQNRVGASVLIFDYPGYGHSSGRPNEKNCYASGLAAYRWLREQGVAAERIVLFPGWKRGCRTRCPPAPCCFGLAGDFYLHSGAGTGDISFRAGTVVMPNTFR
jgi:hypothetical protein